MRFHAALLLASSWVLFGACAPVRPDPPSAVEVKVAVPVPCRVPEPLCPLPAYDSARPEQPGDVKVRLLRVEAAQQAECLREYRRALAACREAGVERPGSGAAVGAGAVLPPGDSPR